MFALRIEKGRRLSPQWAAKVLARPIFPHIPQCEQRSAQVDQALLISAGGRCVGGNSNQTLYQEPDILLAIWGRVLDLKTLGAKLGSPSCNQTELAVLAWRRWGQDCHEHLTGEFSLVLYEQKTARLIAMRDPLGIKPLYLADLDSHFLIATSIPAMQALTEHEFDLCDDWLAKFISGLSMSKSRTAFRRINKVPPGHYLVNSDEKLSVRRYHQFAPASPSRSRRDPAYCKEYRKTLEQVVAERLDRPDPIGIEISGGIDSSTIAGLAPRLVRAPDQRLHGFGFVTSEEEPAAVLGVSRYAGLANNHLFTGGVLPTECRKRGIEVLGHPAEHGNAIAHIPFYKLGRTLGIRTLFSGFGGDEGVTNYAPNHRRDLINSKQYWALWQVSRGNPLTKALRFGKALYEHRHRAEFVDRFRVGAKARLAASILSDDVAQSIGLEDLLLDTARWDAPYETVNEFALGMLAQPFVSTRTESCSLIAASYGIEYTWPLLDPRLIQNWLAAPTIEKVSSSMGRLLHRNAIEGIVPDNVRLRPSKYLGGVLDSSAPRRLDQGLRFDFAGLKNGISSRLKELVDQPRLENLLDRVLSNSSQPISDRAGLRVLNDLATLDRWLVDRSSGGPS